MNRRDFGKLLAELNNDLRNEIAELKTDISTTKRLNTSLKNYFDKCEDIVKKITDEETGVEAYHELVKSTKTKVDEIKLGADQRLQEISTS
ncbi:MAG TPA: hypothetical protein VFW77_03790, partial [Candidatus Saccharimonadales bacterium]|nr:hypothetical protein [Candidatus Saccharimonadales bacterium]